MLKSRGLAKTEISRHSIIKGKQKHLSHRIKKLDKLIDTKISNFNSQVIKDKIDFDGTISKQDFWKIKRKIAPKSVDILHSLTDIHDNEISDPLNIKQEYHREFQHRLRKRDVMPELERYESIQNKLCMARIKASEKVRSPDFSFDEIKHAVSELKTGRCMDPTGLIREVFKTAGDGFLLSVLEMVNFIKRSKVIPIEWGDIWIKTLKKKKGSHKKLKNYQGIFIVPILSIIFGHNWSPFGIPMGTNCAPLLADLFLYSYENEVLDNMIRSGHRRLARSFNLCYRYIDDLIVFNNKKFLDYLKEIYPSQLTVEKANKSDHLADYLDLTFIIDSGGKLSTRLYDKRDDFDFHIVNFPFLSSNIPSGPSYGVYISQLIRYARCCSHYDDFRYRHKCLVDRLLSQGYKALRSLSRNFMADIRISLRNIGGQSMQW